MRILTDYCGPTFECRINHSIKKIPQYVERMQKRPTALSSKKVFPNLFLFNIYRQKTTKLSYRECIHGIIINILRLSFEGNTIYELTFTNLYIYTKHTHLSNKVDFGIGQNDFPFSTVNSLDSCWGKDSEHIFAAWEYKTAK